MKISFSHLFKSFLHEPQWEKVRGIVWFCLITTIIHITWRFWAINFNFYPIHDFIIVTRGLLVNLLFTESTFLINQILNIGVGTSGMTIITSNNVELFVGESASGLKQMIQFSLLIMIFPGPWIKKAWFIPVGIIIIHLTNVFRVLCLTVIALHWRQQIHYAHDNWLRILFYVVIFGLWVVWVEKISVGKKKT
jgi:exosortase/archaeosortase family protein